jgi:hypothetical protein
MPHVPDDWSSKIGIWVLEVTASREKRELLCLSYADGGGFVLEPLLPRADGGVYRILLAADWNKRERSHCRDFNVFTVSCLKDHKGAWAL